ncbi:hypothetical protein BC936DRAFT_145783 [Jimgerdemannia flammicorona]|uniref:Uncharacterized protein n=2 Tax=Jimgerdemannia flammicorona TaxID=994334 RepID=A0A433QBZ2_9FUNG|nr:hypothetical protein BC936DRAFT_145783 [Jimgerdemannia flammicorona]RUS27297.1 hypothetical protein BC938DRAFT_483462 [Jimgerdemannia flammicorona]
MGLTHATFLRNSKGMDIGLEAGKIWYRILSGVLDFYFFLGPMPAEAAAQYMDIIGRPQFVPRWALGFHQCR